MNSRFETIEIFSSNKDFLGCPVEIEKWALLFDKVVNSSVLQIKLKKLLNISINSVDIQVLCYDESGCLINSDEPIKYTYYSCNTPDNIFGTDKVINLNTSKISNAEIIIENVISERRRIWEFKKELYVDIAEQKKIPAALYKRILYQYSSDFSDCAKYIPVQYDDRWQCTCGKLNINTDTHCLRCHFGKETVFDRVNIASLVENYSASIKQAEEEAKARSDDFRKQYEKKNTAVKRILLSAFILIFSFATAWTANRVRHEITYNNAKSYLKQQQYSKSIKAFNSLPQKIYQQRIVKVLIAESDEILDDFKNQKMSYKKADNALESFKKYSKIDSVSVYDSKKDKKINIVKSYLKQVNSLNDSREAFKKGKELKDNEEYIKAVDQFRKVTKSDSNFSNAEAEISKCMDIITNDTMSKLAVYKSANDYQSALNLIESTERYINKDVGEYYSYFSAIKKGEGYISTGAYFCNDDLYDLPNENSNSGYYISGSGTADVYEYKVDSSNRLWIKVKCVGGFYWIKK